MKRTYYLLLAGIALLAVQCKKGSTDDAATDTSVYQLSASINGIAWDPVDTLSATITYHAATQTKVLHINGITGKRQMDLTVTVPNATSANSFPLQGYQVDATGNPLMVFSTLQTDASGNNTFVPVATASSGNGAVTITAVDAANGTITGSFTMTDIHSNYDNTGKVVSVTNTVISAGAMNNMPYKFISQ